jgi:hypothetical protein
MLWVSKGKKIIRINDWLMMMMFFFGGGYKTGLWSAWRYNDGWYLREYKHVTFFSDDWNDFWKMCLRYTLKIIEEIIIIMVVLMASSRWIYFWSIENAALLTWCTVKILFMIICSCVSVCLWTYIHALHCIVNYPTKNKNSTGGF